MEQLGFGDYTQFACDIADRFDSLEDEYGEVSIIAKYSEAREIIGALICLGYNISSIDIHKEEYENYWDEYILSLSFDGIWCEKFKRDTGYFIDESNVIYIMDNCSSKVIPYCKSKNVYEVSVGENNDFENRDKKYETEHTYTVNGKSVDKKMFDEYVSKFTPGLVSNKEEILDDDSHSISIKCNLDADEALTIIADMERRITRMNDIFREMNCFR